MWFYKMDMVDVESAYQTEIYFHETFQMSAFTDE